MGRVGYLCGRSPVSFRKGVDYGVCWRCGGFVVFGRSGEGSQEWRAGSLGTSGDLVAAGACVGHG